MTYLNLKIAAPVAGPAHGRIRPGSAAMPGRTHGRPRQAAGRWFTRVWNWLVAAGEARVRARIQRGVYYF